MGQLVANRFGRLNVSCRFRMALGVQSSAKSLMWKRLGPILCGALLLAGAALIPSADRTAVYLSYSLLALTAFGLTLADGSSMGFVFVILALPQLAWTETIFIAGSALFILAVVRRSRPTPKQLMGLLGITTVAILASQAAFHASSLANQPQPLRLMIAAVVCFLPFNFRGWRKLDLWSFPYYPVAAGVAALFPMSAVLVPLLVVTWRSYRLYGRRLAEQCEQSRSTAALHQRTMETLALAIEARDQPVSGRSRRVQIYAVALARELELPEREVEALRTASLLYDIGELAIPEYIILKSGRLTHEEFEKVKTHAAIGAAILERAQFPYPVVPIVRSHHECWDGSGYPDGLRGEQIPAGARILAVVDAIDSLASDRQHRSAIPLEQAVARVVASAGSTYDPRVAALIAKHYRQWEKRVSRQPDRTFIDSIFSAQREAKALLEFSRILGATLDPPEMFVAVKQAAQQLTSFETLVVWVEKDGSLRPAHFVGHHVALFSSLQIPLGCGVSGKAAEVGDTISNGDPALELAHLSAVSHLCPFQHVLSAPLRAPGLKGALSLYRTNEKPFSNEDGRLLTLVAAQFALPLANGFRFQQMNDAALTDALTGLPNSTALAARLADLGPTATVVVCDLDGFKDVNDRFGHVMGNKVLEALAQGLRRSCRERDFIARMGGDEFVLILPLLRPEEINARLAQFRAMVRLKGMEVCGEAVLDASFGAASFPRDGATTDELLACADRRMYQRKAEQKAGVLEIQPRLKGA
jgi:diguanylate cyclase (GGDEF)-like protein/putative nucleotidyltransferase with HDIG domain